MKITFSTHMSQKDINDVLSFISDYDTDDLTIIFADRYRFFHPTGYNEGRTYKISRINPRAKCGIFFYPRRNGETAFLFQNNDGSIEVVRRPAIVINMEDEKYRRGWWKCFTHEFGHYVDWKTNGFRNRSTRDVERVANEYANRFGGNRP